MRLKRMTFVIAVVALLTAGTLQAQTISYKIVANKDVPVSSLSQKEISNLFLKKVSKWSNGETVQPLDLVETSTVREKFSRDIHGRKVSSIKAYWQKQIFSGRKIPPPEKKSDREVLAFVSSNPGAIGYISAAGSNIPANIKIIAVK